MPRKRKKKVCEVHVLLRLGTCRSKPGVSDLSTRGFDGERNPGSSSGRVERRQRRRPEHGVMRRRLLLWTSGLSPTGDLQEAMGNSFQACPACTLRELGELSPTICHWLRAAPGDISFHSRAPQGRRRAPAAGSGMPSHVLD